MKKEKKKKSCRVESASFRPTYFLIFLSCLDTVREDAMKRCPLFEQEMGGGRTLEVVLTQGVTPKDPEA